jgi:hypothetical protein
VSRPKFWGGLEATGYPFEIKVAEELEKAGWDSISDYPVSVLPDAPNLPVEETAIDFKSWHNSLFAIIEARRAAYCEWVLFRKARGRGFFVLSHHEDTRRRPGFQFHLRRNIGQGRSWIHSQSVIRFQTDRGIYFNAISLNSKEQCKEGNEDQRTNKSEIRKGAKQASIATIGVVNDDYAFMKKAISDARPPGIGRLYFPVITTAAKIMVLDITSNDINEHGVLLEIENINRNEVPWAIYRYSLPRSLWLPVYEPYNVINNHSLLGKHRKLDIFVVNIMHLKEFLNEIKDIVE